MTGSMAISLDLLSLLRCPATRQKLFVADPSTRAKANALMGMVENEHHACRSFFDGEITAAVVSADQRMLYPVRNGIPVLLIEAAVVL